LQVYVLPAPLPRSRVLPLPRPYAQSGPVHGRAPLAAGEARIIVCRVDRIKILAYSFKAAMNSFLSSLACFIIEINVPFASSG
jgi:hypothetical protein